MSEVKGLDEVIELLETALDKLSEIAKEVSGEKAERVKDAISSVEDALDILRELSG